MTDEELQKEIKKTLPEGYIIITSGKVQEGDIIVIFNVDNIMWREAYNFTIGDNVENLWGVARKQYQTTFKVQASKLALKTLDKFLLSMVY